MELWLNHLGCLESLSGTVVQVFDPTTIDVVKPSMLPIRLDIVGAQMIG